jgi:hypothetical protein
LLRVPAMLASLDATRPVVSLPGRPPFAAPLRRAKSPSDPFCINSNATVIALFSLVSPFRRHAHHGPSFQLFPRPLRAGAQLLPARRHQRAAGRFLRRHSPHPSELDRHPTRLRQSGAPQPSRQRRPPARSCVVSAIERRCIPWVGRKKRRAERAERAESHGTHPARRIRQRFQSSRRAGFRRSAWAESGGKCRKVSARTLREKLSAIFLSHFWGARQIGCANCGNPCQVPPVRLHRKLKVVRKGRKGRKGRKPLRLLSPQWGEGI